MANARIAVLFDAENINCMTAQAVLWRLAGYGSVPIRRAVGDFSSASLVGWIDCARDNGIELILQPGLGKGKNGADIRLTIEAMDIVHQSRIDTVALVTRDRDFAPLAFRLRHAGIAVWGFAQLEPSVAFREACTRFEVLSEPPRVPVASGITLEAAALAQLRKIAVDASKAGPVTPGALKDAVVAAAPELATRLSGNGKFLKTLVAHGIVERVGSGAGLLVQAPRLKRAG